MSEQNVNIDRVGGTQVTSPLPVSGTVALTANQSVQDAADGTPAKAAPPVAIQTGGTDTLNLRTFSTDQNGNLNISPNGIYDLLSSILLELRAMRLAMVSLACQGNLADPQDFSPFSFQDGNVSEADVN
jgi:hypothetical protein